MNENKTAEVALKSGKNFEFPYGIRFAYVDIEAEGWEGLYPEYGGLRYNLSFRNSHAMKSDMVATVCFNKDDEVVGFAVTSKYDQFERSTGRNKAYGRYLQAIKHNATINGPDVADNYMIVGLNEKINQFVKTNLR